MTSVGLRSGRPRSITEPVTGVVTLAPILGVDLSLDERRDVMVVRVSGDVDLATAPRLRASLLDLAGRGHRHLELDLRLVDFLDSSGIGVLLGALRRARLAGGSLRIAACGDELRRLFSLLDLEAAFGLDGAGRS